MSFKSGLGTAMLQNGQPIAYASRALTATAQQYAPIEKELLAVVFTTEKIDQYTFGHNGMVETDHKPLETIVQKPLCQAPKRLQRMLMRSQRYKLVVRYKRGSQTHIADPLSRAYQ